MEVEEIAHHLGEDQQRGIERLRVGRRQCLQLVLEFGEKFIGVTRRGHGIANLLLDMHRLGEGAQVEADDRALEPRPGGGDGSAGGRRVGRKQCFRHRRGSLQVTWRRRKD